MDNNTMSWVAGAGIPILIAWCFTMTFLAWTSREAMKENKVLLEQQRKSSLSQEKFFREMAHYVKWWVSEQTGKTPPPPVQDMADG